MGQKFWGKLTTRSNGPVKRAQKQDRDENTRKLSYYGKMVKKEDKKTTSVAYNCVRQQM